MTEEDAKSKSIDEETVAQESPEVSEGNPDKQSTESAEGAAQEGAGESTDAEKAEEKKEEPVEMVEIPKTRLEELENAEAIFKDQLMRERAESINYRKRLQKQRDEFAEVASARVLSKVLSVKDDIKRFIDNANGEVPESHLEGIELVQQRLEGIFNAEGVELIKIEEGKTRYDPKVMEAVVSQPIPGVEPNMVIGVINQGFKKGDRVLRAAKVMISKAVEKPTEPKTEEETTEMTEGSEGAENVTSPENETKSDSTTE